MPELPEVEVTRRSLLGHLPGSRILAVRMGKPLRWPLGMAPEGLVGRQVQDVRRRGKYLLLDLDQGVLVVHLGMSGRLRMDDRADMPPWGPHDHFELDTTQGVLRLNDPRRFGAVVYAESAQAPVVQKLLGHLGMENEKGTGKAPPPAEGAQDNLGVRHRRRNLRPRRRRVCFRPGHTDHPRVGSDAHYGHKPPDRGRHGGGSVPRIHAAGPVGGHPLHSRRSAHRHRVT